MEQRSSRVKGLVFGGVMAALVTVFVLVPVLSVFMPIPLVLAYVRFGPRVAALTGAVAGIFAALFIGPVQALFSVIPAGILPGLVTGYGFSKKLKPLIIGMLTVVVFASAYVVDYMITRVTVLEGRDPIASFVESEQGKALMSKQIDQMESIFTSQPAETDAQKAQLEWSKNFMRDLREHPTEMLWAMIPFSLFLFGSFAAWVNYMLCRWILPRFGHEVPKPTPFAEFRLSAWAIWVYLAAVLGSSYLGASLVTAPWWVKLLFNFIPPLMMFFMVAGIAVAYGFLRKRGVTKPVAVGLSLTGFLLGNLGTQLYIMLATWDSIFDFRGLGHGLFKRPQESP